jgi:predicted NAD/FAD-dependent oxidoreductase
LAAVVRETLARGGSACVPLLPRVGLSESLIDPALDAVRRAGGTVRLSSRVSALDIVNGRVTALRTADEVMPVATADAVVLAVPASVAVELLPGLVAPEAFESIINVHFTATPVSGSVHFYGLAGGLAEWVFIKPGHVSVTISAANRLSDMTPEMIAAAVWPEVARAIGLLEETASAPPPAWRVLRERRATFAATSAQEARRPKARTGIANLALAGDWTATGLPATIEGAIRSGRTAANVILPSA